MCDNLPEDPDKFIEGCKEFVLKKVVECEELAILLCMHPESPRPAEEFRPVLSEENIKDAADRLNKFFDEEGDDVPLLPKKSPEKKSSRLLRPQGRSRRSQSTSPSPTRKRIKKFLENEYENLCKMGTKFKKAFRAKAAASSPSRKKTASSSKSPTRTSKVILDILVEISKIEVELGLLDALITVTEEEIKCLEVPPELRRPPATMIMSMKNSIYLEYRHRVAKKLKENKEVLEFVRLKSGKSFGEDGSPSGTAAKQPHVPSPSRKLTGPASSKASPKHMSGAGPSTSSQGNVSGEASSGTPKRNRTKSLSRQESQEKKKKVSPKTEDKSGSPDPTGIRKDTRASSPELSDSESRDTVSSRFDASIQDLDLSETEDS